AEPMKNPGFPATVGTSLAPRIPEKGPTPSAPAPPTAGPAFARGRPNPPAPWNRMETPLPAAASEGPKESIPDPRKHREECYGHPTGKGPPLFGIPRREDPNPSRSFHNGERNR